MEETIGYEALFSAEEWDAYVTGDWSDVPNEDWGQAGAPSELTHTVTTARVGATARFELSCAVCEDIGDADSIEEAEAIARLHEAFIATLVEKWTVTI